MYTGKSTAYLGLGFIYHFSHLLGVLDCTLHRWVYLNTFFKSPNLTVPLLFDGVLIRCVRGLSKAIYLACPEADMRQKSLKPNLLMMTLSESQLEASVCSSLLVKRWLWIPSKTVWADSWMGTLLAILLANRRGTDSSWESSDFGQAVFKMGFDVGLVFFLFQVIF